jgi:hypothetical protein
MFKRLYIGLLSLGSAIMLVLPCSAFSQITISKDDILGLIGTVQQTLEVDTTATPKTVNVGMAGGSQSWDFDSIAPVMPIFFTGTFVNVAGTPFEDRFPTATIAQKLAGTTEVPIIGTRPFELYNYFEVTDTDLRQVGDGAVIDLGVLVEAFFTKSSSTTPAPLPVAFGQSWTSMGNDTITNILPTQSTEICSSFASTIIDAWGTALVGGETVETLRICSVDTTICTEFDGDGNLISGPDTLITISYSFPTVQNGFIAQLTSLPGETNPNFNLAIATIRVREGIITSVAEFANDGILPTTFDLSQNYPNPFNPATSIRYTVGKAEHVEVAVFNLQGRLVKTLIDREMPVGQHTVSWDGTDAHGQKVASGRYIYRLSANSEAKSKIMVLVK